MFSGESDSWKGEYSANLSSTKEQAEYIFTYKQAEKETAFKNLAVIINDGQTIRREDSFKGATVKISTASSGGGLTQESDPIKVTIKWDDGKEESFVMEPR